MKRGVSLFEAIVYLILYGTILAAVLLNMVSTEAFGICIIFVGLGILTFYIYIIGFSWRGLPKGGVYNPTGFVEIHVENICNGRKKDFIKICLKILLYCIDTRKNIMFDTWLIKESRFMQIFDSVAEVYEPSLIQSFVNYIFKHQFRNKPNRRYYRCIIYTDKLNREQRAYIIKQLRDLYNKL